MLETETPKLNAPIVLTPGLWGFDRIVACGKTLANYFHGIPERLEAAGNRVFVAHVSPTEGVVRRAHDLKRYIESHLPSGPFHLIGHSMGGLDSRYFTAKLGMEKRVLSVTSVATPHRGTAFADWGVRQFSRLLGPLLRYLYIPHQAFFDLTTESCQRFNEEVRDVPGVRYSSIAGQCEQDWLGAEWLLPYNLVAKAEGPNDGVVSVASAAWGEHSEVWAGDHLNLVNWPNRHAIRRGVWPNLAPDYGRIIRRLSQAGF